ncbi:phage tail tape measure protein [Natronoglomus mannanivorans]|uniref:Phage tail tape measure protein n=1 Tax=Natronoglomus mannanivorans TaxID=2979990 RepID=A0AAP2Z4L2_9EURY|nr:phage tail tape measure protein [Halobacteria archaeon AArc-xg1-1]
MGFTPTGGSELEIQIEATDEGAADAFNDVESSAIDMRKAVAGAGGILAGAGAAGLASSANAAADFEQAMADVEKVTDPQTAAELSDSIKDLAGEIPMAHEELATLATQAGRMGAEGEEEIANFTETAAMMGTATELSADEAGTALGKLSSALDEPLDNVDALADGVNEVSNNFATDSEEIVDAAQRSGQALSTLGLQSDKIIGLSGAFNEVSPSSEQAAQRMQQVAESMMDPGNVEMFADLLGVTAEEFEAMRDEAPQETMMDLMDSVEGNDEALETLNDGLTSAQSRAFRDTASSADEMREAMETSSTAMEEGGSTANEMAAETDTFHGQMALLSNEVENVKIAIGEQLLPVLMDIMDAVRPAIQGFMDFNESLDGMPGLIILVGSVLTGLAAIAVTVGPAIVGALSPILVPVAAIAAAIGALYYVWKNDLGGIQEATRELWDTLQPILIGVKETLMDVFEEYAMPMLRRLKTVWEEQFSAIMEEVVETMDVISEKITVVLGFLESYWNEHGESIMTYVSMVFDFLELTIGTAMRAISTLIQVVLNIIQGDFDEALSVIWDFWETTFNEVLEFLTGSFTEGLKAGFNAIFGFVRDIFESIYDYLIGGSIVPDTFNEILVFINDVFFEKLKATFYAVFDFIQTIWTNIYDFYVGIWTSIFETVSEYLTKSKDKIQEVLSNVANWIGSTAESLLDSATFSVFDTVYGTISTWMGDSRDKIENTVRDTASWVSSTGRSLLSDGFSAVKDAVLGVFTSLKDEAFGTIVDLGDDVLGKIRDIVGDLQDTFNDAIPDSISIPEVNVGGGRVNIPSKSVSMPDALGGGSTSVGGGSLNIPSEDIGGQSMDLPQLADGGIVDSTTIAMIGEAGQEAVVPLHKLNSYLDTAYEAGQQTATQAPHNTTGSSGSDSIAIRLEIEGEDELAELIRDNAEVVVEENEQSKSNRISRM